MSKGEFASSQYTAGQLNAMVKVLKRQAGEDGPGRLLRGDIMVSGHSRAWYEERGVVFFSVTSNGRTGDQWIRHFLGCGYSLHELAIQYLASPHFQPTVCVTTQVAILRGALFSEMTASIKTVRAEIRRLRGGNISPEVACLIRDKFTKEEILAMGFRWIVTIPDHNSLLFRVNATEHRDNFDLDANSYGPNEEYHCSSGFAFATSTMTLNQ